MSMLVGEMESKSGTDGRYRTLLEVSGAIASQPNLKAVLQSLRRLLSSVVAFDSVSLCLLSDNGSSVRLIAFDRSPEALQVEVGTEIPHVGSAVGRAIDEQKPIYVPDLQAEMSKYPQLASQARRGIPHSAYIFPISISGKKLGALTFATAQTGQFGPDDVELMTSVSLHVAVALESALATDAAEVYQRQLAQERDRLRLLLEINNQVVTQLDTNELFRSASASIRKYLRMTSPVSGSSTKSPTNSNVRFSISPAAKVFLRIFLSVKSPIRILRRYAAAPLRSGRRRRSKSFRRQLSNG
jgi:formate hydrogenlyase transcriptional activator